MCALGTLGHWIGLIDFILRTIESESIVFRTEPLGVATADFVPSLSRTRTSHYWLPHLSRTRSQSAGSELEKWCEGSARASGGSDLGKEAFASNTSRRASASLTPPHSLLKPGHPTSKPRREGKEVRVFSVAELTPLALDASVRSPASRSPSKPTPPSGGRVRSSPSFSTRAKRSLSGLRSYLTSPHKEAPAEQRAVAATLALSVDGGVHVGLGKLRVRRKGEKGRDGREETKEERREERKARGGEGRSG